MLTEPIAVMLTMTEALEELGISYLIGGSMASAVQRSLTEADQSSG